MSVSLLHRTEAVVVTGRPEIWRLVAALMMIVTAKADVSFTEDIQPIFRSHCYACHGPEKQKSGLRLDLPARILQGGDSGEPVFVAGESGKSHLIQLVTWADPDEGMPPKGERLTTEEVRLLRLWIDEGAGMPGVDASAPAVIETDHWSFQPVRRPQPPGSGKAIDAFVGAKLEEHSLSPSPEADRRTLIRRLYLVAHGLPPTPEEVEAFIGDARSDAYERLVDRVLKSPRYGERWARHWLDVVRYADTNGFETNRERKTAYHYRDYVIRAFNEDKPYDQFIVEQIAGDAVGADVATGFLVAGPYDIVKSPDPNLTLMQRQDELADMVNTTGTAFLGLTMGCARCHNHKFDPVLQKDYYAMQAVFAGVNHGERAMAAERDPEAGQMIAGLERKQAEIEKELRRLRELAGAPGASLREPVNFERNDEVFPLTEVRFVKFTIEATSSGEPCIDELEVYGKDGVNVAPGATPTASGTLPGYAIHQLEHVNDGRVGNGRSWISNTSGGGWVQLEFDQPRSIERIVWGRDRLKQFRDRLATRYVIEGSLDGQSWKSLADSQDRRPFAGAADSKAFVARLKESDAERARALLAESERLTQEIGQWRNGPQAWLANFSQPPTTHRLYRGEPTQKREAVAPDALTVMGSLGMEMDEPEQQRRLKLARWIASEENPLTARVLVNRVWHYIFGTGLAETPSDLGANGIPPTHSELLDWLAHEFMDAGWSIKHLQRLILTSQTFRQSSQPREDAMAVDAGSRYLWRFPPRRLEAEAIRDSILAVSGALDLTIGGPGFYLHRVQVENVMHYFPKESFSPSEFRRMVYLFKIRQEQDAIFGSFDCPDGNQVIPKRSRSNTPLQALNLFNSAFVLQQAEILAQRLVEEGGGGVHSQIERAFNLFYGRSPDAFERRVSRELIEGESLTALCRALYNSSEFLFVF